MVDFSFVFFYQLFEYYFVFWFGWVVVLIEDLLLFGIDFCWLIQVYWQCLFLYWVLMNVYVEMFQVNGFIVLWVLQGQVVSIVEIFGDLFDQGYWFFYLVDLVDDVLR